MTLAQLDLLRAAESRLAAPSTPDLSLSPDGPAAGFGGLAALARKGR